MAARRRKREFGVTDPLAFPPCEYNKALFSCNYPLIRITYAMPAYDKFGALQMKEDSRSSALAYLLQPALKVSRSHNLKSELGGWKLHSALFDNLPHLTMPSQPTINKILKMERDFKAIYPHLQKRRRVESCNVTQLLANAKTLAPPLQLGDSDMLVSESEGGEPQAAEEDQPSPPGSGSGLDQSYKAAEETTPDAADAPGKGRIDIQIFVFNNSNQKLKKLFKKMHDVVPQKAVVVIECKWDKEVDDDALLQAAAYACQQALSNLANLHFSPIYLLALTRTHWTYGILDCRGCVKVMDGRIDTDSLPDFSLHENMRFPCDPLSQTELESQLEQATKYFQQFYTEKPKSVYPNKSYLVGNLHVRKEWFQLPNFQAGNGAVGDDVSLFYEGLLRIIIGDKVNGWEVKDFEAAKDIRDGLMEITSTLLLAGHYVKAGW